MNIRLVEGWQRLWKAWTVQLAAIGIFLPDLLQLLADNSDLLPWMDTGWKSIMRLACLIGILFLRPVKQVSLEKP